MGALSFAGLRTAIDVLKNRLPGSLAMTKAKEIGISIHSRENLHGGIDHWCTVSFFFGSDSKVCGDAYRSIERLYEMERNKNAPRGKATP